jgi:hypothetical protein
MAQPTFALRSAVHVSPDPSRDDYNPGQLRKLPAGTRLHDLPQSELLQLAPEHFADLDDDGQPRSDELPEDWRTDPATLEHDKRQAKLTRAEAKERDARRKAARAEQSED